MDPIRFDTLARTLAARLPRRGLGPFAAALLGLSLGHAGAKRRKSGNNGNHHKDHTDRTGSQDTRDSKDWDDADRRSDRHGAHQDDPKDHAGGAQADGKKKKKPKCAGAGGSCKKPKQGKPKKCCDGLSCDGATKRCTAPPAGGDTQPLPPDGRGACGQGLRACNAGCLPTDETCCPVGQRPCDGSCSGADICCETEFSACMAPVAADWEASVAACSGDCATPESDSCQACTLAILETFADPLITCMQINCMGPSPDAGSAGAQRMQAAASAAAATRTCDLQALRKCKFDALKQTAAALGYAIPLAMLEGPLAPITASAALLFNAGTLAEDYRLCETQHGCPNGACDPHHGVCCGGTGACEFYDPGSATCKGCPKDTYCKFATGQCVTQCKRCDEYLVDGRAMPCGDIINNCGQFLTCASCRNDQRCVNRRCVSTCASKTCAELGVSCGPADDGCGGAIDCGICVGTVVGTISARLRMEVDDPDTRQDQSRGFPAHAMTLETYRADYVAGRDSIRLTSSYNMSVITDTFCIGNDGEAEAFTHKFFRTWDYEGTSRSFEGTGSSSGGFALPDANGYLLLWIDPNVLTTATQGQSSEACGPTAATSYSETFGLHPDNGLNNASAYLLIGAMSADGTWQGHSDQGSGITHFHPDERATITKTYTWAWNLQLERG
jgi:hypothetical protein